MRYLQHNELHLVKPKFQQMVIDAWNKNENVPYGVIALSDQLPSDEDIKRTRELANQYGWE